MKTILSLILLTLSYFSHAGWSPYCSKPIDQQKKVIAYLGADSQWDIEKEDLEKLRMQLNKVDVVNYAFVRLDKDDQQNFVPKLTTLDLRNLKKLRELRPNLPIMIAIGGWGDRDGFTAFVNDPEKRARFIESTHALFKEYQLDGIDIDWENEHLASDEEIKNIAVLMQELKASLGPSGYCISNAVPGTQAYWKNYPHASLWSDAVNWTTVMAYDNYGTFGQRTEFGAALHENDRPEDKHYPYPKTSGNLAVSHYYQQGLPAEKIILGIPFYCHSYYVDSKSIDWQSKNPGLHVPVIDPNINSQVNYVDAWKAYGQRLFAYQQQSDQPNKSINDYGLIPIKNTSVYRFMSCDSPKSIANKMNYIKGEHSIAKEVASNLSLGGASFWSLQQDLPVDDPNSLLAAIYQALHNKGSS